MTEAVVEKNDEWGEAGGEAVQSGVPAAGEVIDGGCSLPSTYIVPALSPVAALPGVLFSITVMLVLAGESSEQANAAAAPTIPPPTIVISLLIVREALPASFLF